MIETWGLGMKNTRFEIMGALGGDILFKDPCQEFSQPEQLSQGMSRGLRDSLGRSDAEWNLAEPVKSATSQIELEALAHWLTEPRAKVKEQIVRVLGPRFDHEAGPEGPSMGLRGLGNP